MLKQRLEQYLSANSISNLSLAVGVSGGVDSMALLDALVGFYPRDLICCLHYDHNIREDSAQASELVEFYCKKQQIKFITELNQETKKQDENSLRKLRYRFFDKSCRDLGIHNILLAHHLDDQVETIVFRLFRGTNTAGLAGIAEQREQNGIVIHRPLLALSKNDLVLYAQARELDFVEDSTNSSDAYARNRIRSVLPGLAGSINQSYRQNIDVLVSIIKEEQEYLNQQVQSHLDKLGPLPWQLGEFCVLPRIIQRKILERSFTTNISFVNDFLACIEQGGFHKINYEKNFCFTLKQKKIYKELLT